MKRQTNITIDLLAGPPTTKKAKQRPDVCSNCGELYVPSDIRSHVLSDKYKRAVLTQISANDHDNKEKGYVLHRTANSRTWDVLFLPVEDAGDGIHLALRLIKDFMKQYKPGLLGRIQRALSLPSSFKVNYTMLIKVRKISNKEEAAVEDIVLLKTENYEIDSTSDYEEYIERLSEVMKDKFEKFLVEGTNWWFGNIIDLVFHFNDYSPFCITCGESHVSSHLHSHVIFDKHKRAVLSQININDGDSREKGYVLHRTPETRIWDVLFFPVEDAGDGIRDNVSMNEHRQRALHVIEAGLLGRIHQALSLHSSIKMNCSMLIKVRKYSAKERVAVEEIITLKTKNYEIYQLF